jgi:hypothetical protein
VGVLDARDAAAQVTSLNQPVTHSVGSCFCFLAAEQVTRVSQPNTKELSLAVNKHADVNESSAGTMLNRLNLLRLKGSCVDPPSSSVQQPTPVWGRNRFGRLTAASSIMPVTIADAEYIRCWLWTVLATAATEHDGQPTPILGSQAAKSMPRSFRLYCWGLWARPGGTSW